MNIFFDTEFTDLRKDASLISIGLMPENGGKFYAEINDFDIDDCSDWVVENVLPALKFKEPEIRRDYLSAGNNMFESVEMQGSKSEVATELRQWFYQFDRVQLISDVAHYDMVFLIDLFGTANDLPANINPSCHDINQDIASYLGIDEMEAFDISREEFVSGSADSSKKHNAFWDALIIKSCYLKIQLLSTIKGD